MYVLCLKELFRFFGLARQGMGIVLLLYLQARNLMLEAYIHLYLHTNNIAGRNFVLT
jgi:hypothetical protein